MTFHRPAAQKALMELSEYKACEFWLHSFRSPATERIYKLGLQLFCRFHNTNPDRLIKFPPEKIEKMLMQYIIYLKKNAVQTGQQKPQPGRIHVNSIANYIHGVKHFLKRSYGRKFQLIDWQKIADMIPERLRTRYRAYTREEIKSLLDIANLRLRVIILLMTSGGMRVGALPALKFKHIKELPNGMGAVSLYADSAKEHYFSFLNLECMATLKRWKEYRMHLDEKVTDESYILRDRFGRHSRKTNNARPLKTISIMRRMRQLIVKVLQDTDNLQSDHAFRKFFNTALMNSDVNHQFKELLMGHSVALDETYYDENNAASQQKILAEYMKASDALTINNEFRLQKEVAELKEQAEEVNVLKSQLAESTKQYEIVQKQLEEMTARQQAQEKFNQRIIQHFITTNTNTPNPILAQS